MRRYGQVIGIRKERVEDYKKIHAELWREISSAISASGIGNYSIFLSPDGQLFGYFEYRGPEGRFEADMRVLASAPRMRAWWDLTEPMQIPRPDRKAGEWWTTLEEVFHLD